MESDLRKLIRTAVREATTEVGFDRNASVSEGEYRGWPVGLKINPHMISEDPEQIAQAITSSVIDALLQEGYIVMKLEKKDD